MEMTKTGRSFQYLVNGQPKWVSAGIFESLWERRMAEYFPLFGKAVHDTLALRHLIQKYRFNQEEIDMAQLSVRTSGCLKKAGIKMVAEVLMMYPFQLKRIDWFGTKSVHELQDFIEEILEIELE